MSKCRSCGAPVRWEKTEAGKWAILNEKPDPDGNMVLFEGKVYAGKKAEEIRQAAMAGEVLPDEPISFTSHFATCPQAANHRKNKLPREFPG